MASESLLLIVYILIGLITSNYLPGYQEIKKKQPIKTLHYFLCGIVDSYLNDFIIKLLIIKPIVQ